MENTFAADMQQVMHEAGENAAREIEEFKVTAGKAIDFVTTKFGGIKNALGTWLPDLELADFTLENMGSKFNELMAQFAAMNAGLGATGEAAKKAGEAGVAAFDDFGESIKNSVEDNMTDALAHVRSFGDAARAILDAVIEAFIRFKIIAPISDFFTGQFGSPVETHAHGGNLTAGRPAIVGERGPELILPNRGGTVIPNHELGAMGGLSQVFNFPLAFPTQLEAMIRNVGSAAGRDTAMQVLQAERGRV